MIKVINISFSDISGGAARATYRIHNSLLKIGIESQLRVCRRLSGDPSVVAPSGFAKVIAEMRPMIRHIVMGLHKTPTFEMHSINWFPSGWVDSLNKSDADIIHLHWIGLETISIYELSKIRKPIVWTLHDMWAFCGSEHYTDESENARWKVGYTAETRRIGETSFDLDRWVWNRKCRAWKQPFHIVCPSRWLTDCVQKSALMKNWEVSTIPNSIDLSTFRPIPREIARDCLKLRRDKKIILFGALGGIHDPRKGGDLLIQALSVLKEKTIHDVEIIIFGQHKPSNPPDFSFPVRYFGHLQDDISLVLLYSACNVFIAPSRQDNLPNTVAEAIACGTPVVAFNIGGMPDLVNHNYSGYLATPYDIVDLAQGIRWVIEHQSDGQLRREARNHAEEILDEKKNAAQYLNLYEKILS